MRHQALFAVLVAGRDITMRMRDIVQSITISDRAGMTADTAMIVLDDSAHDLVFPPGNAPIEIRLGVRGTGLATAFAGTVDELRHSGGRGGTSLTIMAKGLDTGGKAKAPQQRHFDTSSVEDVLRAAGADAGVSDIRVDPDLASHMRTYEHMDDESFIAFGERLAREIGGTFKMRTGIAILAKKNAARTPSGAALPPVHALRGKNLHSWDITPYIGRPRYKQIRVRFYDARKAKHDEVIVDTGVEGSDAIAVGTFRAPNKEIAEEKANALKAESARGSGVGSLSIEGNVTAQPEATCLIAGARIGIDGAYVIDGVDHMYSRGSGFVTKLSLAHPL